MQPQCIDQIEQSIHVEKNDLCFYIENRKRCRKILNVNKLRVDVLQLIISNCPGAGTLLLNAALQVQTGIPRTLVAYLG